jgi:PIN domain nuclease of toxin-antitoxin system
VILLLDTHAWIWSVAGERIGRRAQRAISRADTLDAIRVSPVSVFELTALHSVGRLRLSTVPAEWIRRSLSTSSIRLAPLVTEVAIDAGSIPKTALADPLDRLIVATARHLDATLLTADMQILGYARTGNVRVQDASV